MTTDHTAEGALSPELEAIAAAAHDRLTAQAGQDLSATEDAARRVAEAASAAIATGARLSAIAAAAHDRLTAQAGQDLSATEDAARRVAEAASAAIATGARLSAIADAEQEGELHARQELSADVLRQVTRAAKRKRDADTEYEQAIGRAGRLGLSHREIATAAQISHGTIRAILTRATTATGHGHAPEQPSPDSQPDELAA